MIRQIFLTQNFRGPTSILFDKFSSPYNYSLPYFYGTLKVVHKYNSDKFSSQSNPPPPFLPSIHLNVDEFPPWCSVQVLSNKISTDYFFDYVSKRRLFFSNVVLFIEQVTQYVVYDEIWQLISLCKLSWIWHSIFEYMYVVELLSM